MSYQLTDVQVAQVWDLYSQGKSARAIARHFNRSTAAMNERIVRAGGIRPTIPHRADRHLTLEEREEISRGLAAQCSFREIARRLGRAPSTVSREVNNNGGRARYRAARADRAAVVRRCRPKVCKLAGSPRLRRQVVAGLQHKGPLSRSRAGSDVNIPMIRRCGCRTRPSTGRCSSSPVAP